MAIQGSVTTGIYPNPVHSLNVLGKVDHQFSGADQLSVRYALYDVTSDNARGVGSLNAPPDRPASTTSISRWPSANVWTISSNTVNETRVQIAHGDLKAYSTDPVGPAVSIAGVATFGTSRAARRGAQNTMYQAVSNVSHRAGAHALRAGVDFLYNDDTITFLRTFRGSYTFSSMANFLAGNYNGFSQTFGDPVVIRRNPNVGFYAQDEWRAARGLTLNAGLRYDLQFLETINTDTNNVSPRAGLRLGTDRFAGLPHPRRAGVFFDRVPLRAVANALLSAGNTTDVASSASRRSPASCRRRRVPRCFPTSCRTGCHRPTSCRSRRWTRTCRMRIRRRRTSKSNDAGAQPDHQCRAISTSAARTC